MLKPLMAYIREHRLVRAGERIGVAVSGGADSVGLLRALLELRGELGVVLSVVHLHHGIRGEEADADSAFVRQLAQARGLELHARDVDVPAYAAAQRIGLEAAGRELRYRFFDELLAAGKLDRIATAHHADDQAETVLLRFLRGAWTRGLSGIHPAVRDGKVIRPMLGVSRAEVIAYLKEIGQPWREDRTNSDTDFLRNRVRHELLPTLERGYNPAIRDVLANVAELARAEQDFWTDHIDSLINELTVAAARGSALEVAKLCALPMAVQRRILIAEAEHRCNARLQFEDVEAVIELCRRGHPSRLDLQNLRAEVLKTRDRAFLLFSAPSRVETCESYEYRLSCPGEILVPEADLRVSASFVDVNPASEGYNPAELLDPSSLAPELIVRNWHPGDRFHPLRSRSEEKLKRLLLEKKIRQPEKALWPVAVSGEKVIWVRGFPVASEFAFRGEMGQALVIKATLLGDNATID